MAREKDTALELYVTGLRNAHALEKEAISIMKPQVQRIENYPELSKRLQEHIRETEIQQERLHSILTELGEDSSTVKDLGGNLMGTMAALGHSVMGDEILKNTFANYAFENFEIASYKSLIALADASGQNKQVKLLEQSLGEEIAMAGWLEDNVEKVTLKFLALSEAGRTAKV